MVATMLLLGGLAAPVGPAVAQTTPALVGPIPTISGTTSVGSVLTVAPGTWTPASVSLAYRWYVDGSAVPGEAGQGVSFRIGPAEKGKKLQVRVTGSHPGSVSVTRKSVETRKILASTAVPAAPPVSSPAVSSPPPVISGSIPVISGATVVGSTLTANPGAWAPEGVSVSFRWYVDGIAVAGSAGDKAVFIVRSGDVGDRVTVRVTGSRTGMTPVIKKSAETLKVTAPPKATITGPTALITGSPIVGSTLTADPGAWAPEGVTLAYRWYVDGKAVSGVAGEGAAFVTRSGDVGKTITVKVTGSRAGSMSVTKMSSATAKVSGPLITGTSPAISGAPSVGSTLTADAGAWGPSPVTLAYRWYVDGTSVSGTAGGAATFVVRSGDVGDAITVRVTGSRPGSVSVTLQSAPVQGRSAEVDDPLLGAARKVVTFDVRSTDINSGYPRSQLNTAKFFDPGEDYWFGFGVNIPAETLAFPSPPPEKFNQMMLFEIYGPPYGKGGPNRLYINEGQFQFKGDGRTVWSAPVPPGAWVDFAVHYKLSSDPAVGYVALAVNDGTGWTQVPLSGSVPYADSGEYRLYYATHKAGTNDGDSNYATIKLSYSESFLPLNPYPISHAVVHITDLRIGSSANAVDPRSFANGTFQPAPMATGPVPLITGTPEVGSTLSATAGEWGPGEVDLAYRWYVGGKAVPGFAGEAPTFVIRPEDVGQTVTAWVSGSAPGLQPFTRMSAQTSVITAPIPEVEPPAEPPVRPPVEPPEPPTGE